MEIFEKLIELFDDHVYCRFLELHRAEPGHNMWQLDDSLTNLWLIMLDVYRLAQEADEVVQQLEEELHDAEAKLNTVEERDLATINESSAGGDPFSEDIEDEHDEAQAPNEVPLRHSPFLGRVEELRNADTHTPTPNNSSFSSSVDLSQWPSFDSCSEGLLLSRMQSAESNRSGRDPSVRTRDFASSPSMRTASPEQLQSEDTISTKGLNRQITLVEGEVVRPRPLSPSRALTADEASVPPLPGHSPSRSLPGFRKLVILGRQRQGTF